MLIQLNKSRSFYRITNASGDGWRIERKVLWWWFDITPAKDFTARPFKTYAEASDWLFWHLMSRL